MKNKLFNKVVGTVLAAAAVTSVSNAQNKGVEWDGFGGAYFSQADGHVIPNNAPNRSPSFAPNSYFGLNLHSKMDEDFSATGQLLARGSSDQDSYDLKVEWAYVTYAPQQDWSIKAGRLLFPLWIAAEYYNVGYLLPYRTLPGTVYALTPFSAYDGVMAAKMFDTGIGKLTLAAMTGTPPPLDGGDALDLRINDFMGFTATLQGDGWTAKTGITESRVKGTLGSLFGPLDGTVYKTRPVTVMAGFKYDKNNLIVWSEYISVKASDADTSAVNGEKFLGEAAAGYALVGYRMGKWTPRYTYATGYDKFGLSADKKNESESHVFGFNYEVGAQAVAKVEYESLQLKKGTGAGVTADGNGRSGTSVYAGVDFAF